MKFNLSRSKALSSLFLMFFVSISIFGFATQDSESNKMNNIFSKAQKENWQNSQLNELVATVALEFLEVPYIGGTLDEMDTESCIVNLNGLDCVTLFENSLAIAKAIKNNDLSSEAVLANVEQTRYRNGKIEDYTSRLHYTADWIYDNIKKNTVEDITEKIGGEKHKFNVSFMSKNPSKYKALKNNPKFVPIMAKYEKEINSRTYYIIPKNKIADAEAKINTGDIIAIATSLDGLDYAHTGIAYRDENGLMRLLHASSKQKKVVLDTTISSYVNSNSKNTGITVLRVK